MRTPDIGTSMREDRTPIDFAGLRLARRERVFAEMERRGLDVCLFGREANGRYLAGQRRLWTSNTRPWLPSTIAVRATGRVHVLALSASVDDAPEDIPFEDIYDRSFDPATLLGIYASIPGLADARRIGVDGLTMGMRSMVGHVAPRSELESAEEMMRGLRRVKLPAEIECIRVAVAIAESALQRAADALRPGVTAGELRALFLERMCDLGTSTFARQGTFRRPEPSRGPRLLDGTAPFEAGTAVTLTGGALWAGYEGSLARTWWCGTSDVPPAPHRQLYRRWRRLMDALLDACRPGRTGADLVRAHEAAGEPLPDVPIAHGVGLGHEGPLAGSGAGLTVDREQVIAENMVVTLVGWVCDADAAFHAEELVHVTTDGPVPLTRMSQGPIARAAGAAT